MAGSGCDVQGWRAHAQVSGCLFAPAERIRAEGCGLWVKETEGSVAGVMEIHMMNKTPLHTDWACWSTAYRPPPPPSAVTLIQVRDGCPRILGFRAGDGGVFGEGGGSIIFYLGCVPSCHIAAVLSPHGGQQGLLKCTGAVLSTLSVLPGPSTSSS